ncbi:MAG: threonine dehydratase [Verrucomicrobia bacterium]|nr:threonine dehydratase [Verrucomicrobiota bacterium]
MTLLPTLAEIEAIAVTVDAVVPPTPQFTWPLLNERAGCELWVKHENHTAIGSFKIRGAVSYLARLLAREPGLRGVVAATRGNFGQAVAFAARRQGLPATIVVPHGNSVEKNRAMHALGAELIEHGDDFQAALVHSEKLAAERRLHWVPSFHPDLALGNTASALDFLRHAPPLDRVYVPIGLGSGICAMMAARDALGLATKIIGVASARAPAVALSFAARRLVAHPAATRIADGMACSTPNAEALEHILRGAERVVCVSDDEIEAGIRAYFSDTHNVAEGAAGAGLAAVLRERETLAGRRVGVVFTGGNIDAAVFARVLAIT